MEKFIFTRTKALLSVLLVVSLFINSCSTDFDVAADWEEITIIYGLLDKGKTNQYIRINKAFLSQNTSALEIAPISDSLYHNPPAEVLLKAYDNQNNLKQTLTLEKVNAADEGLVKDEGLFASNPYFLYKTSAALNATYIYKVEITTADGKIITAQTPVIDNFDAIRPDPNFEVSLLSENYTMRWSPSNNVGIYDMDLIVKYDEQRIDANGSIVTLPKTLKWNVFSNLNRETSIEQGRVTYDLNVEAFFNVLLQNLSNVDSVQRRFFKSFDFYIHAGSNDLKTYNDVTFAQFGVTSSQNILEYSNVEGGLGLFASRYSKFIENVKLTDASIDLLACDPRTTALKFATHPGSITFPNCF
ncbi:MAG: DUF4249 family protein [Sphingobacteriales bacterium]|nr:MAG: DUF4249 family protein [Sphingobacteriales bacterium]